MTEKRGCDWKRRAFLAALTALSLLGSPTRASAATACKVSSLELPVTMVGSRAVATLGINGAEVRLIVDSGAFYSFLTHAAAQQFDLKVRSLPIGMRIEGLTGEVEAGVTTVRRLNVRDGEIPDIEFVVGGNAEADGTMGLLGRNLLAFTDVEYDLAHGAIRLMFPNDACDGTQMAYWSGDKPVSELALLRDKKSSRTPAIRAIANLNGESVHVLFDTGAQSLVSRSAAKRAGITDMKPAGKVWGAGRGEAEAWSAAVDKFEIGGETIANIHLRVADITLSEGDEMLLGIDFFLSHRIYISKKQRRMYFTYNGGAIFALDQEKAGRASAAGATEDPQPADGDEPTDATGYARRGGASAARLDYAPALADLNRACELAPQVAEYFVRRAVLHLRMQHAQLALKDLDTALTLDPAQAEALLLRAQMRAGPKTRESALADLQALDKALAPQAHERLQMAQLYERLGLHDRALPQLSLWIPAHPEDVRLATVLNSRCWGRTLLNIELNEALVDCNKAIDLDAKNGNFYDSRAWLRLRRGDLDKALSDFERALKLAPNIAWSLYGRGIVRGKLGEAEAGRVDIAAARKLLPMIDAEAGRHGLAADTPPASAVSPASSAAGG